MTPQHLYRFELNEIPSVDLTCNQCSSVIRFTLPKNNLPPNMLCAGCGAVFWYEGNTIYPAVQGLIRGLGSYLDREQDQNFKISFSLVSPASSDKG